MHAEMVRFSTRRLSAWHLPLTSWFPYLGLGSPHLLHYQSLAAMVTGLVGLGVSPDAAFRWSLYLLLSLWPISVYLSARLFGSGRWAAATSAAMAPFVVSVVGIGYEPKAYVWTGWGVWTQLWASVTLPLAWGFSWRAIRSGHNRLPAVLLVAGTVALHFETGYLALAPLLIWPFVVDSPIRAGLRRGLVMVGGSLLTSAWVIVPLVAQRHWAATNEVLRGTTDANGYGAARVVGWLASGRLLDYGRLPVVTLFAAVGLALACVRLRRGANSRALLVVMAISLVLSFGRATFGDLVYLLPGGADLFFRRFMMGVQLVALILAGSGATWVARGFASWIYQRFARLGWRRPPATRGGGVLGTLTILSAVILVLAPAWLQAGASDSRLAAAIQAQRRSDVGTGEELNRLVAKAEHDGGGRVYAGMPSNWGRRFTVGAVPVYEYLASMDVDEVGFTLRTASLMTDPEYYFDEANPGDYALFGVHYLVLPPGKLPAVPADLLSKASHFCLWRTRSAGYVRTVRIVGDMPADRTNVGTRSIAFLRSPLPQTGDYLRVTYGGRGPNPPLPRVSPASPVGGVVSELDRLDQGVVTSKVTMTRPGAVVLSASFDPGWRVTVDGRADNPETLAPALVGVDVTAGIHLVSFRYQGFGYYPELFGLAGLTVVVLALADRHRRRLRRRRRSAGVPA